MAKNKYRVHRFKVKEEDVYTELEFFLNNLEGAVVSIISNIKKGSLPQIYRVTSRVDFLMIVERL